MNTYINDILVNTDTFSLERSQVIKLTDETIVLYSTTMGNITKSINDNLNNFINSNNEYIVKEI